MDKAICTYTAYQCFYVRSLETINQTSIQPECPPMTWFKDFGSFKLCGEGKYPKTFPLVASLQRVKRCNS